MDNWKPIPGWENYRISSKGQIQSKAKGNEWRDRTPVKVGMQGRLQLELWQGNRKKTFYIAVLVASVFIGPKPFKNAQVDHLDGNFLNNNVDNLEWVTQLENKNRGHIWS